MPNINPQLLERVKSHALGHLTPARRQKTNLYFSKRLHEKGERLGPPSHRVTLEERVLLIFADDDPTANWGHACRYLLYHPETGELLREVPARLPAGELEPFYTPVQFLKPPAVHINWPPRPVRCPVIVPEGNRYTVLFAGFTMERHLNDLEFCYRTLVNDYAVPPKNITVLSFDGTMTVVNTDWSGSSPAPATWPGDGTPYQIVINGQGTPDSLEDALDALAAKLGSEDLLFIHTNNHGDTDNNGAYMGYPSSFPSGVVNWGSEWVNFYASTFAGYLTALPAYRALIVMMEQCGSGGFGPDILQKSTAGVTSFSAACQAWASSYVSADGLWDSYAYQWIAAMAGNYPNGSALLSNPDTDGSFHVDTGDAYNYALANQNPLDSPNISGAGSDPNKLVLVEEYGFVWFWCWLWTYYAQPLYGPAISKKRTPAEFYRRLQKAAATLQSSIMTESTKTLTELRHKLGPQIKAALEAE
jgi:hypothetical protein